MSLDIKKILKLFSFSDKQLLKFKYLSEYSIRLNEWLSNNTLNDEQVFRFMLIGFFVEYRGSVHLGSNFRTIEVDSIHSTRMKEKSIIFNESFNKPIKTTQEYLQLVGLKKISSVSSNALFNFVIYGEKIN